MVSARSLKHIPGNDGWPIVGQMPYILRDAERWAFENYDRYGPVHRMNFMFEPWVVAATPDLAKMILLDRTKVFSSEHGWRTTIGELFKHGLMLRDFEDHRFHRKIMQEAFRSEAMSGYLKDMNPIVAERVGRWQAGDTARMYGEFKQLTLDIATQVFVGIPTGAEADRLNRAFIDTVQAAVAPIRRALPLTAYRKGMEGRRYLQGYFASRIPERRGAGRRDLFSRLCDAVDEDGDRFSDEDIVDHMIFLLMAAHDTTTSTLATMAWELARNPEWQDRLAAAVDADELAWEDRGRFAEIDWVFKEAMRLHPPVPFVPRRALEAVDLGGYRVPTGTPIAVSAMVIHRLAEYWSSPHEFDPTRFEREEDKAHSHLYFPFSGGAHTCIGMHFAGLMTKAIMVQFLNRFRLEPLPDQEVFIQTLPIPKPRGGLPLKLTGAG